MESVSRDYQKCYLKKFKIFIFYQLLYKNCDNQTSRNFLTLLTIYLALAGFV